MGKIVISENITLDGVVQDPTGEEDAGYGSWTSPLPSGTSRSGPRSCSTRRSGPRPCCWAGAATSGSPPGGWAAAAPWADRLNSIPKYVVSATLGEPRWGNSTVLKGDVVSEVQKLRQQLDGDILVIGSTQLAHALLEHDLADELRLMVYPVVLGAGQRLLGQAGRPQAHAAGPGSARR